MFLTPAKQLLFMSVGKNLWNGKYLQNFYIGSGALVSAMGSQTTELIAVLPSTNYTISTDNRAYVRYVDENKNYVGHLSANGAQYATTLSFRTPANCAYLQFYYTIDGADTSKVMLELGNVKTAYEPYTGE